MSSLVRRNVTLLLPRLLRAHYSSLQVQQVQRVASLKVQQVQRVASLHVQRGVHGRAKTAVRLQEHPEPSQGILDKSTKLEEKLVRFLGNIETNIQKLDRVLKFEVENSIKIIKTVGSCSSNQALLLLKCHGEVGQFVFYDLFVPSLSKSRDKKLNISLLSQVMVDGSCGERTAMLGRFVELIANLGVRLDISHYNCILKVRSGLSSL